MTTRLPARDRKVVPISEGAERRRTKVVRKSLQDLGRAADGLADDVDAASHFVLVGNMALIQHVFEEAIVPFSRALALAPDDVNARSGRARAYAALGKHTLALADFDRAAALAPDNPLHQIGRANACARLGRLAEAVAATSRAIEVAPDHAGAHYTRAIYRSQIDPEDPGVRADLDRTVELAPHEVPYLRGRADYLMDSDEWEVALGDIDRALAITPDDAQLHYLRAECLTGPLAFVWNVRTKQQVFEDEAQPRCVAALASLERALDLGPHDELLDDIHWALVGTRELMPDRNAYLAAMDQALGVTAHTVPLLALRQDVRRRQGDFEGAEADRRRLHELGFP